MLLRRVIEHVKAQNWTAVGLDFIIVVVGVFMGIQVNNWNEARLLRAEEKIYLQRLYEDMTLSIAASKQEMSFRARQAEQATLVIDSLKKCSIEPVNQDDFAQGLFTLGKFGPTQLVRTAVDELKSTGKFDVIENADLREQLQTLVRDIEEHEWATRTVHARIEPHVHYIETIVGYDLRAPKGGNAPLAWEQLDFEFEQLCADRRFARAVSAVRHYTYNWIKWGDDLTGEMEAVRAMLEDELGVSQESESR